MCFAIQVELFLPEDTKSEGLGAAWVLVGKICLCRFMHMASLMSRQDLFRAFHTNQYEFVKSYWILSYVTAILFTRLVLSCCYYTISFSLDFT
jgi:hypothetical protein